MYTVGVGGVALESLESLESAKALAAKLSKGSPAESFYVFNGPGVSVARFRRGKEVAD
ncbi:hypothetical protein [Microcystis phage Mwe-JY26]